MAESSPRKAQAQGSEVRTTGAGGSAATARSRPAGDLRRDDTRWSSALLAPLFEAPVRYGIAPVSDHVGELPTAERDLVERAVASRRHEFSSGRVLARRLLSEMGKATGPILRDADRVPIWPADVVGSISHCRDVAVVALAPADACFGLGVDVEPDQPVSEGVERVVCTAPESAWLDATLDPESAVARARQVKLVFSIKEAVYKAFYPRIRVFWSFQDVSLKLDEETGCFEASLPASADRPRVNGRFLRSQGTIVSAVVVR